MDLYFLYFQKRQVKQGSFEEIKNSETSNITQLCTSASNASSISRNSAE